MSTVMVSSPRLFGGCPPSGASSMPSRGVSMNGYPPLDDFASAYVMNEIHRVVSDGHSVFFALRTIFP